MMGGKLWVDSEPGHGSCFHFTTRLGLSENRSERQSPDPDLTDVPVLIVDDNATNRLVLQKTLANWGMRVKAEASACAATACAQTAADSGAPVQLVIADAHMPGEDGFDLADQLRQTPQCATTLIVMLTSASQPNDSVRCREGGITAHLPKPVNAGELRRLICRALAGKTEDTSEEERTKRALAGEPPVGPKCKILLAEDNLVNQTVARHLLEKHGHQVFVAANGREAVEAMRRDSFDLVFMDVQMPEMDGFEATAAIRRAEADTGRHIPIFAMTAHAMKGDDELCRAAGMDGYLPKPVRPFELYAIVDGCLAVPERSGPSDEFTADPPVLDRRR
jgi:CheY-like chemotaxis protein